MKVKLLCNGPYYGTDKPLKGRIVEATLNADGGYDVMGRELDDRSAFDDDYAYFFTPDEVEVLH